jgi:hypothetical protein
MPLCCMSDNKLEHQQVHEFAEWILNIGEGKTVTNDGDEFIEIPNDLLL